MTAGPDGAIFAVFTTASVAEDQSPTSQGLRFRGPFAEALAWQTFEARYTHGTPFFDGLDAHLAPGFHLLDADGAEIAYVFVWAAGKGVDLSTHDHGRAPAPTSPAFAEVHLVLQNGTGTGGMYETSEPGAPTRVRYPMQQGEEHGPFFEFDPATGSPRHQPNGAVAYPWHGWEAGTDDLAGQAYDVVAAFEITAPYALASSSESRAVPIGLGRRRRRWVSAARVGWRGAGRGTAPPPPAGRRADGAGRMAGASPPTAPAATRSPAGSAGAGSRRRSSGTRCRARRVTHVAQKVHS